MLESFNSAAFSIRPPALVGACAISIAREGRPGFGELPLPFQQDSPKHLTTGLRWLFVSGLIDQRKSVSQPIAAFENFRPDSPCLRVVRRHSHSPAAKELGFLK